MDILRLDHDQILRRLPDRPVDAHKYCFGRVLMLCGSEGYTGAAALAAMGALRVGAGLVYLGVPRSVYAIEAVKLLEPVVFPLPDHEGKFGPGTFAAVRDRLQTADVVLIGPGLGSNEHTRALVLEVLERYSGPVILDADGINVLCGHTDILRRRTAVTVLTPHAGEFERIGGPVGADPAETAAEFARRYGCILLLKGHNTLITDGKTLYVNSTGNPGMAVGGCGDVLAGMIAGLMGQGIEPLFAAAACAWLHGRAGDLVAQRLGQYGLLPSDMLAELPRLLK